jgi:hypothetical protein
LHRPDERRRSSRRKAGHAAAPEPDFFNTIGSKLPFKGSASGHRSSFTTKQPMLALC